MHQYKELKVWGKSMELAIEMYSLTKNFPRDERFGITSQIRKCGVSIVSNIAEGAGRNTNGEFIQFIGIAEGSTNELETQITISKRLGYITIPEFIKTEAALNEIRKMLFSLKKSLRK